MPEYIDLTQTITHGIPVFPGEQSPSIIQDVSPEDTGFVTHRMESNFHSGTHMDAAWHAKADSVSIDLFPISNFVAKAYVIDVNGLKVIHMQPEWEAIFNAHEAILFHTGYSHNWLAESYYLEYPVFDNSVAIALAKAKVRIVGFDSPSPDISPFDFHKIYLREGRFMIENMTNLHLLLNETKITLFAFPLKVKAEASLIRAVACIS